MGLAAAVISIAMLGTPSVDPEQHECLALNVYHEARGEVIEGQIAVAHVTLNRVNHSYFPETICDVVYQNRQFSWTFTIKDHTPKECFGYSYIPTAIGVIGVVRFRSSSWRPSWSSFRHN